MRQHIDDDVVVCLSNLIACIGPAGLCSANEDCHTSSCRRESVSGVRGPGVDWGSVCPLHVAIAWHTLLNFMRLSSSFKLIACCDS